jgi:pimeloyl-ACP methyl ester carboxylesterase
MAISNDLGQQHEVTLPQGTISYRERGTGDPIVFVHGALVNADLWRKVVPRLAKDHRCIAPDLPRSSATTPAARCANWWSPATRSGSAAWC